MTAGRALLVFGVSLLVLGAAAVVAVFAGASRLDGPNTADRDPYDELALAHAAGVVPGSHDRTDMPVEERAAETAWRAELFAASPDAPATGINP